MEKSRGERKRKYLRKNKNNRKKDGFSPQKNPCSAHKSMRMFVKSYMKQTNYDHEILSEFFYPKKPAKTYTWWDVRPGQPKYFKTNYKLK
jgi:hypothetical protein